MRRVAALMFAPILLLTEGAPPTPALPPVSSMQLEAMLHRAVDQGSPGLSAAIADCHGVVWTGVAGRADIAAHRPIAKRQLFGVGSITKVFLAVVVLQLVEEERLKLTDTPQGILGAHAVRGIANAGSATVADLLGHRGGVPSWEDDARWIRKGRGDLIEPTHHWGKTEALDFIRGTPATAPVGEKFAYSNSEYTLLGLMIEKVSGNTAEAEVRSRILTPLGLTDTYMEGFEPGESALVPRRYQYATEKYRHEAGVAPSFVEIRPDLIDTGDTNLSDEWVAGGLVSSPRDLLGFAQALRNGRLLKSDSLAFMEQWTPAFSRRDYGHGLFRIHVGQARLVGHTGGVLGFSAVLWWSADSDLIVAVLGNGSGMHAGSTPPKATTVGLDPEFVDLAIRYAGQRGECPKGNIPK